jgi:hypothetical protein
MINTGSGLAINPGPKLKNYTYTLHDVPQHDTYQVQTLPFPNVCFYSIINHILQATCKCFAVVQFPFQVLIMTDMITLD